jgi:hypothetical protein
MMRFFEMQRDFDLKMDWSIYEIMSHYKRRTQVYGTFCTGHGRRTRRDFTASEGAL